MIFLKQKITEFLSGLQQQTTLSGAKTITEGTELISGTVPNRCTNEQQKKTVARNYSKQLKKPVLGHRGSHTLTLTLLTISTIRRPSQYKMWESLRLQRLSVPMLIIPSVPAGRRRHGWPMSSYVSAVDRRCDRSLESQIKKKKGVLIRWSCGALSKGRAGDTLVSELLSGKDITDNLCL